VKGLLSPATLSWMLIFCSGAQAASFDCTQATSPVEKTICANPQLEQLDSQLGQAYVQARKSCPNQDIQNTQRHWLRDRRNRCSDASCLIAAYQARLAELKTHPCHNQPTPCPTSPARLLGNWKLVSEGGPFEEMAFTENAFNSWLHQRPELAGAHWRLEGCRLTIRPGDGEPESRLTLLQLVDDRLSLREEGERDTAIYRRIK